MCASAHLPVCFFLYRLVHAERVQQNVENEKLNLEKKLKDEIHSAKVGAGACYMYHISNTSISWGQFPPNLFSQ